MRRIMNQSTSAFRVSVAYDSLMLLQKNPCTSSMGVGGGGKTSFVLLLECCLLMPLWEVRYIRTVTEL